MGGVFIKAIRLTLKIVFIFIALAVLILPALYTNSVFGYLPPVFLAILVVFSGVYLFMIRRGIRVVIRDSAQCKRGAKVAVSVRVENASRLACPKVEAELFLSDYFAQTDSTLLVSSALDAKSESELGFDVTLRHVGLYTAGVKRMKVYGLFGFFSAAIPVHDTFEILVLPKAGETDTLLEDDAFTDRANVVNYAENDGFDYTGVREYALGDSMKRIHWKLSAHTSTYMTKINEVSRESDLTVILDMVSEKQDTAALLSINDALMETMASITANACKEELEYRVLYPDWDNQLAVARPATDADYAEIIRTVMPIHCVPRPEAETLTAEEMLQTELQSVNAASNLVVCTSRVTDSLVAALIAAKEQRHNPILYRVIESSAPPRRRDEATAELRLLDEYAIAYAVLSGAPS